MKQGNFENQEKSRTRKTRITRKFGETKRNKNTMKTR